jgi:hypothetical protein
MKQKYKVFPKHNFKISFCTTTWSDVGMLAESNATSFSLAVAAKKMIIYTTQKKVFNCVLYKCI